MSVDFCGLRLAHPIINGSGTFDAIAARRAFGEELATAFPFAAYVSKTITLEPRAGNPPPRLWETPGGLVNSIGLPNKGLAGYLAEDLPQLLGFAVDAATTPERRSSPVPLITNVMGSTREELQALVAACDEPRQIAAIELNVSCPNVRTGLDIGADPAQLESVVAAVRDRTAKPLIVKLTPNAADVPACAQAAEAGGADAVSLINTLRATALAPGSGSGAAAMARRRHGRALGPRHPADRPGPGGGRRGPRRNPRDRNGRRAERRARPPAARSGRHARRRGHRELPRSRCRRQNRRWTAVNPPKTPANTGPDRPATSIHLDLSLRSR